MDVTHRVGHEKRTQATPQRRQLRHKTTRQPDESSTDMALEERVLLRERLMWKSVSWQYKLPK